MDCPTWKITLDLDTCTCVVAHKDCNVHADPQPLLVPWLSTFLGFVSSGSNRFAVHMSSPVYAYPVTSGYARFSEVRCVAKSKPQDAEVNNTRAKNKLGSRLMWVKAWMVWLCDCWQHSTMVWTMPLYTLQCSNWHQCYRLQGITIWQHPGNHLSATGNSTV